MNPQPILRTLLYIPGNNPGMINSCDIYGPDCLVLDLEDSVPLREKDAARDLIAASLTNRSKIFPKTEQIMVRVNSLDSGFIEEDLRVITEAGGRWFRIPKIETAQDILIISEMMDKLEDRLQLSRDSLRILAIIETVKGLHHVEEIATCSKRLIGLTLGAEDFTRDLGTERSREGKELEYARGRLLIAARIAGILAIDTVFSNVTDEEGLLNETRHVKQLGFDGKSIIHPRQIEIIHQIFTPDADAIDHALRIQIAMQEAESRGSAAVAVDGRMVDTPVLKKALRVLEYAKKLGLLDEETQS
jgi:citrate lyase subunit beta/citryl-CoA lyase